MPRPLGNVVKAPGEGALQQVLYQCTHACVIRKQYNIL